MIELRPWGKYEVVYMDDNCKVKKITVSPNQKLSYQYHLKRQERWVITKGILTVVLDDNTFIKYPGDGIYIPFGVKHRAWNNTDDLVEFIEVQTGEYFGEDDIVRLEDDYNRT